MLNLRSLEFALTLIAHSSFQILLQRINEYFSNVIVVVFMSSIIMAWLDGLLLVFLSNSDSMWFHPKFVMCDSSHFSQVTKKKKSEIRNKHTSS